MRKEKALIGLLRGLVDLLVAESAENPGFASKMEALLSDLPEPKAQRIKPAAKPSRESQTDIYAELNSRGEEEFRLWLRDQPITALRAVIRSQDLDPTKRTAKWKEARKIADYIVEALSARVSRGGTFMERGLAE